MFLEEAPLFEFLKKVFARRSDPVVEPEFEPEFLTKPCRTCGRPISYNPEWKHIPNYCKECKAEFRKDHKDMQEMWKDVRFPGVRPALAELLPGVQGEVPAG